MCSYRNDILNLSNIAEAVFDNDLQGVRRFIGRG